MRIIAADDEPNALEMLLRSIKEALPTAEVRGFSRSSQALAEVEEMGYIPDVAFLDIEMPGMGGIELAKCIKDIYPNTNIIFVTGYRQYAYEASEMHASGYVLKPVSSERILEEMDNLRYPIYTRRTKRVKIQCFGSFELFVGDTPMSFKHDKSKEMLARIVDRAGAEFSFDELPAALFPDKPGGFALKNLVKSCTSELMHTLRDAGLSDVLIRTQNGFCIDVSKVDCDYYQFLTADASAVNAYKGEYMTQYDWATMTVVELHQAKQVSDLR